MEIVVVDVVSLLSGYSLLLLVSPAAMLLRLLDTRNGFVDGLAIVSDDVVLT